MPCLNLRVEWALFGCHPHTRYISGGKFDEYRAPFPLGSGFIVQGFGVGYQGSEFMLEVLGESPMTTWFRAWDLGFRGIGFRVQGLGFRVWGSVFRVKGSGL